MDEDYELFDPCPDCGSLHLIHHFTASEDAHLEEGGDVAHFEPRGDTHTVQEVWCPECDEKIWEQE